METAHWMLSADLSPSPQLRDEVWECASRAFVRSHRRASLHWIAVPAVGATVVLFVILRPGLALFASHVSLIQADQQLADLERELELDAAFYHNENSILEGGV